MSQTLSGVSRTSLEHLRDWVAAGKVRVPLRALDLQDRGLEGEVAELLARVLGELSRAPLLVVLDTIISERGRAERERPRLLWTGPEAPGSAALDTRVKLLEIIDGARESVFWAGYRFTDRRLLEPLYERMCTHKLDVTVVLEVNSDKDDGLGREQRISAAVASFLDLWPGQELRPRLYIDPRTAGWNRDPEHPKGGYFALMHAKAVVVDDERCIVGSANFTDAGTTRNIEAGVFLQSREFARTLLAQWRGLIANELLREIED